MAPMYLANIFDRNKIDDLDDGRELIYIDLHLLHEISSQFAFFKLEGKGVLPDIESTIAFDDHVVPTINPKSPDYKFARGAEDCLAAQHANAKKYGVRHYDINHELRGIVHVTASELGHIIPGMVVVCGDSHTCTLGAIGAVGFGIGSSECAQVLCAQSLIIKRPKLVGLRIDGSAKEWTTAKDIILYIINQLGVSFGANCAIEYSGTCVSKMNMASRFTLCNMTVELGAKIGIIPPDDVTFEYLRKVCNDDQYKRAHSNWQALSGWESGDVSHTFDVSDVTPRVTWGTKPSENVSTDATVPLSTSDCGLNNQEFERVLDYMGIKAGQSMQDLLIDYAFIGSCTNSRYDDLVQAAKILKGKKVHKRVKAILVPGSRSIGKKIEEDGTAEIYRKSGFEIRDSGCSMCVAINGDIVPPGMRCISSSNRNFEGRQGPGSRTHIASPCTVAISALEGHIATPSI